MLRVMKKAVLLHPLSPREGPWKKGEGRREFFESLRPAQKEPAPLRSGARGRDPRRRPGASIEAEPEIQRKNLRTTIVQRRV